MSLAFDKTQAFPTYSAIVAYSDINASLKRPSEVSWAGLDFRSLGNAGFSPGAVNNPSLAIGDVNSKGTIFVVYLDNANGGRATVQSFFGRRGPTGPLSGAQAFLASQVGDTSIALDSAGTPYVAYQDVDNANKAIVQKLVGGTWTFVGNAGFSAGEARSTCLSPSTRRGRPGSLIQTDGNGYRATVQKLVSEGGGWTVVGNAGFSAGPANYVSLALDSTGTPFVAYSDGNAGSKATVQKLVSGTWTVVGNAGFSAGVAIWTCLALDKNGIRPGRLFRRPLLYTANSGKATVQYYS